MSTRKEEEKRLIEPHGHNREKKQRMLDPAEPFFNRVGISDTGGKLKPSMRSKYIQVDEFLKLLDSGLRSTFPSATKSSTINVADLGCGSAYLTFATATFLEKSHWSANCRIVGIDTSAEAKERNNHLARWLGWEERVSFRQGEILETDVASLFPEGRVDVVVALHACDEATDDALAVAAKAKAPLILAAPCCHAQVPPRASLILVHCRFDSLNWS